MITFITTVTIISVIKILIKIKRAKRYCWICGRKAYVIIDNDRICKSCFEKEDIEVFNSDDWR